MPESTQIRQNSYRSHATFLALMHGGSNPCSVFPKVGVPQLLSWPIQSSRPRMRWRFDRIFRANLYICSSLFFWLSVSVNNVASVLPSLAFVSYSGRVLHGSKFHMTTLKLHQSNQALHNTNPIRSHKYRLINSSQWSPCRTILSDSIFRRLKLSHLFQAARIMDGTSSSNQFPDTSSAYSTRHPRESRMTSGSNPKMLSGISQMQELISSREEIKPTQPTAFGDI